jgi:hypothetical protein
MAAPPEAAAASEDVAAALAKAGGGGPVLWLRILPAAGRPAGEQGAAEVPECGPLDMGTASSVQHVRQLLRWRGAVATRQWRVQCLLLVQSPVCNRDARGLGALRRSRGRSRSRSPGDHERPRFPGGGVGTGVTMGIVAGAIGQGLRALVVGKPPWAHVGTLTLGMMKGASVGVRVEGLSPSKQGCRGVHKIV